MTKKSKGPGGRPAKTLADLPPNWKEKMIEMAAMGYSEQEMRRELSMSMGPDAKSIEMLWYRLKDREPEFRETFNICKPLIEAWWIGVARQSINKQFFQHQAWLINMKNRFGWKDKTDIELGLTDEAAEKLKLLAPAEIAKRATELAIPKTIIDADTVPSKP